MMKKEFYYPSADGRTKIHAVEWLPEGKAVAILQISHGMTEYILRYEALAEYFTQKGFIIVGNDHLGHGTSIGDNSVPMYFGPRGSWNMVVRDLHTCKKHIQKRFPDLPYCLLGFSLGSFVVRTYMIRYPGSVDAAILAGTGQIPSLQIAIAKGIAHREARKAGEDHTTPMIKKLTFETYNKKFAPNRTEFDWLCAHEESLDAYIADSMRGGDMTAGLFGELLWGMAFTGKLQNMKKMDKNTPVLFVSGDNDPVGDCGKGVLRACKSFEKAGVKDVTVKLYPKLRHDILHEGCRETIYNDLYKWLESKISRL